MINHWHLKRRHQQGTALVMVLSLTVVILMFGVLSSRLAMESTKNTQEQFRKQAQASNIARAGLRDAIGWFKNSNSSGVISNPGAGGVYAANDCAEAAFDPSYNSEPSLRETIDPSVGLVKDLQLDGNLYGRYIVRKQPCKVAGGSYLPGDSNYDEFAVRDVTALRGKGEEGDGAAWHLVSEGIIYQRNNPAKNADGVFTTAPDVAPNRILEHSFVEMDISRMTLQVPHAPIMVTEPSNGNTTQSQFNAQCKVVGRDASAALFYDPSGGQNPSGTPECQYDDCTGGNDQKKVRDPNDPMSVEEVFSISKEELKSVADYVYADRNELEAAHYQDSLGRNKLSMALYYLQGNFVFDNAHVVQGNGILFVDGDLTLESDSFTFTGLVYVTGKLTMKDNNEISGAAFGNKMVCQPTLKANFEYNEGILTIVRTTLALYRENTLTYKTK